MSRASRANVSRKLGGDPPVKEPAGKTSSDRSIGLSPAGSKIVAAFEEAINVMRSEAVDASRLSARFHRADFATREYGPDDVRRVRGLLGMSQAAFARFLGVNPNTIQSWEHGTRPPSAIARRFMDEIESDPDHWKRRVDSHRIPSRAEAEELT